MSPQIMAAYAVIAIAAIAVLWRLSAQWQRHQVAVGDRMREFLALVLVTGAGLALVAFAQDHFQRQADAQRLQTELQERDRIAAVLRTRITNEVDAVRAMLADRTVRNIERDTLATALNDLARFASLKDPRITQMLALIDTELEIRTLVAQSLSEQTPDKLARIYTRLIELAPGNQEYRDKAAQLAAAGTKGTN